VGQPALRFEDFLDAHRDRLARALRSFETGARPTEVAQEAFLKLWERSVPLTVLSVDEFAELIRGS
jgi:DNA-directed RNA polymerase specialized sigma24 family protein